MGRFWLALIFSHSDSFPYRMWLLGLLGRMFFTLDFSPDQTFEGLQTTAAVLAGIGMFFLFLSCCVPHPQTVECLSGTIFMVQAMAQASAIGIMTILKKDFYDGEMRGLSRPTSWQAGKFPVNSTSCATIDSSPPQPQLQSHPQVSLHVLY